MGLSGLLGFGLSKPKPGQTPVVAPTLTAQPPGTLLTPPSVTQNGSFGATMAQKAAERIRKKNGGVAGLPKPTGTVLAPVMQPKTLLGY